MALNEIITFMQELAQEEEMQVCVKQSLLGGLVAGATAVGFSILMGPLGLLIGGSLGGGIGALLMQGKYVSAVEIIRNMNPEKKERLRNGVRNIMQNVNATDVAALTAIAAGNTAVRNQLVQQLITDLQHMNFDVRRH